MESFNAKDYYGYYLDKSSYRVYLVDEYKNYWLVNNTVLKRFGGKLIFTDVEESFSLEELKGMVNLTNNRDFQSIYKDHVNLYSKDIYKKIPDKVKSHSFGLLSYYYFR